MPKDLRYFRVFVASPGGLADERKAFRDEIAELNAADAIARGFLFEPVGWEDTLGGVGRPQNLINKDIQTSDYLILVLWNRWGSSPDALASQFSSGTEEEYHLAISCYEDKTMSDIVVMFKAVDSQQLSDAGPQLQKVLEFREELERTKEFFYETFDTTKSFRSLIRRHLSVWLRDAENHADGRSPTEILPSSPEREFSEVSPKTQEERPDESGEESVISEAWNLARAGRLTEAEIVFAKGTKGRDKPRTLIEYGQFLLKLGRLDQARTQLEWAISSAEEQKDDVVLFNAYGALGHVFAVSGDFVSAERMCRNSLAIGEQLGDSTMRAQASANLGSVLSEKHDLDGADHLYRQALAINVQLGRSYGIALANYNLGNILAKKGDLDGAERMYCDSLETDERIGRTDNVANIYEALANLHRIRGNLDAAEEMYRKALEIQQRLGNLQHVARDYGMLGVVLQARGDLSGAEQMARKALEINERLGDPQGMAIDYGTLGSVLQARGDIDNAEKMYRKAIAISDRPGRPGAEASDYSNMGGVLEAKGDLNGAKEMYEKALTTAEKQGLHEMIPSLQSRLSSIRKKLSDESDDE